MGDDSSAEAARRVRRARERVETLASETGRFGVACKDTGRCPEPVSEARFETFAAAEAACAAASAYREAMRRLDPSLPEYDLVVSEVSESRVDVLSVREETTARRANGLPKASQSVTLSGGGNDEWLRVENGPVVHLSGPDSLLDDEFVSRQLQSKL